MWTRYLLLCLCLFLYCSLGAQTAYKKGVIIDSIPVYGTKDQSYALYLPKGYQENQQNSIVFIFEPAARAAIGIRPFIPTAEKYGHILVCSNNSRNSTYDRNFGIANNLFNHIFSHFNIKESEMYLSGFSGGSRLVCAIASVTNQFSGVVACGAGFPNIREYRPSVQSYSYAGLIGDRDMNYKEMLGNRDYLHLLKFNSTLITYDGDHSWPPPEQVTRAFDWLHLQNLQKAISKDSTEVMTLYSEAYKRIQLFTSENNLLRASEQYERTIEAFKEFVAVDSLVAQHQSLLASKPYKKQTASFSSILKMEQKIANKLGQRINSDFKNPKKVDFGWWEKELDKLNAMEEREDAEIKKMTYRIKFDLFAKAYSRKNPLLNTTDEEQAELANRFIKLLYPN